MVGSSILHDDAKKNLQQIILWNGTLLVYSRMSDSKHQSSQSSVDPLVIIDYLCMVDWMLK